eukprot:505914-Prorocentrum_minimum.AAC.3
MPLSSVAYRGSRGGPEGFGRFRRWSGRGPEGIWMESGSSPEKLSRARGALSLAGARTPKGSFSGRVDCLGTRYI